MTNRQESQLKELEEENELLLLQLHQVQEELERYYLRCLELEGGAGAKGAKAYVDDELPALFAEKLRLEALAEAQRKIRLIESTNSLNVKLGNLLIEAADQPGRILGLPAELIRTWRRWRASQPCAALGGEDFSKFIADYEQGGFDALAKLEAACGCSPATLAKAYTSLARRLRDQDRAAAARAAWRAFELDPKPFRLKWLAFRVHEAGNPVEAEALAALLPTDIAFSESESRQLAQLRYESKTLRLRQAEQQTNFRSRREAFQQQIHQAQSEAERLKRERDEQARQLTEQQQELTKQINELKKLKAEHEQQLEENELLLQQLHQVQEELERYYLENQNLNKQAQLASERQAALEVLERDKAQLLQAKAQLEQEKAALAARGEEQARLAAERLKQINELQQQIQRCQAGEAELAARQ